jgi:hypothetical protein
MLLQPFLVRISVSSPEDCIQQLLSQHFYESPVTVAPYLVLKNAYSSVI